MKIRIATGLATGLTAALAVSTVAAPATSAGATSAGATSAQAQQQAQQQAGTRSLAKVLAKDGHGFDSNWKDFDILDKAVLTVLAAKPDSPLKILTQGKKRVTAFLPTDAAFRVLVTDLTGKTPKTEKATFAALAALTNASQDVSTVELVLLYHVVPGATITYKQAKAADGTKLVTAMGKKIKVDVKAGKVTLVDLDKNARDARVIAAQSNINKGNRQIAHAVDRVLRPLDL